MGNFILRTKPLIIEKLKLIIIQNPRQSDFFEVEPINWIVCTLSQERLNWYVKKIEKTTLSVWKFDEVNFKYIFLIDYKNRELELIQQI